MRLCGIDSVVVSPLIIPAARALPTGTDRWLLRVAGGRTKDARETQKAGGPSPAGAACQLRTHPGAAMAASRRSQRAATPHRKWIDVCRTPMGAAGGWLGRFGAMRLTRGCRRAEVPVPMGCGQGGVIEVRGIGAWVDAGMR